MAQTPLPGMVHTPLPGMAHTPLHGVARTPLPGTDGGPLFDDSVGGTPITPNEFSSSNNNGGVPDTKTGVGRPNPYMVTSSAEQCFNLCCRMASFSSILKICLWSICHSYFQFHG